MSEAPTSNAPVPDPAASNAPDELVQLERRDDGVALLRLTNGKVNTLSQATLVRLHERVQELLDELPSAVVITGNEKAFAAGAEIKEFGGPDDARRIGAAFTLAFNALAELPRVTIAAVNGVALGGGCELAISCDFRIAADTARFGQPEILLGIIPGAGGTQRLPRLIGPARAKELVLSGRTIRADEALRIGLVDEVVPAAEVVDHALEVAASYGKGALVAQAIAKRSIDLGLEGSLADGLVLEQEMFVEVFKTDDSQTGVRSFLENGPGKATFDGR
jgi:enoyl-CoA hydratase/carnithine racemase